MSFDVLREQVVQSLVHCGVDREALQLTRPPRREFGDLSSNIAFELASQMGKSPREIAQQIFEGLELEKFDLVDRAVVAGAGFINFYINYDNFGPRVLATILEMDDHYGDLQVGEGVRVVVEHTSVNPNKPWHVGHARNAVLGDVLGRIFRKAGYEVEIQNYIDDTGKQVADTLFALEHFGTTSPAGIKFDHFVGREYTRLHRLLDESETVSPDEVAEIDEGVERILHELEQGVHRSFVERCVDAQLETAWRMGIFYDLLVWEEDIVRARLLKESMTKIQETEYVYVAQEGHQKGCLVIEMGDFVGHSGGESKEHHVDKVLIRSNQVPTYTAKDIAFQMWKFGLLQNDMRYSRRCIQPGGQELWSTHPDGERQSRQPAETVINVIGFEQEYPQQAVRAALKIVGYEEQFQNTRHLAYGHVWLPEGRMSGRKGVGVSTDEVIDATVSEAHRVVREKRGDELEKDELARIAEAAGVGAVRFAMLRKSPESQVTFRLNEVVSFAGYTSLYLQYAYVRASSILDKAGVSSDIFDVGRASVGLDTEIEKALIYQLGLLPAMVGDAAKGQNPSLVCQYGYDVAQAFSKFHKTSPVLKAHGALRLARLRLVKGTATVLRIVMDLLGISVLERM